MKLNKNFSPLKKTVETMDEEECSGCNCSAYVCNCSVVHSSASSSADVQANNLAQNSWYQGVA